MKVDQKVRNLRSRSKLKRIMQGVCAIDPCRYLFYISPGLTGRRISPVTATELLHRGINPSDYQVPYCPLKIQEENAADAL